MKGGAIEKLEEEEDGEEEGRSENQKRLINQTVANLY